MTIRDQQFGCSGNDTASGTPVDLAACNGGAAQAWLAQPGGTLRINGMCLAIAGPGAVSGTPVVQHATATGSVPVQESRRLRPQRAAAATF